MHWLLTYPEDGPSVPFYRNWLATLGIESTLLPAGYPHPGAIASYAALLLPGGGDVEPERYGDAARHPATYDVKPGRDELEIRLIREFQSAGKPVFGICRGLQILNVARGGKLIQHLPDVLGSAAAETHSRKDSYDARHPIRLPDGGRLEGLLGSNSEVNSSHHQAIHPDHLGEGLRPVAVSPAGVIEAVECFDRGAPMVAVQWHPERMDFDHPASGRLLAFFKELAGPGAGS
jgi:putative glutamine amidotransferase